MHPVAPHPAARFAGVVPAGSAALALALALALPAQAADSPGRTLAKRQNCLSCHAVDAPMVGPAYKAVAERYAGQADAAVEMARHIRAGGTGRWGPMAMPPQAQLSESDARKLAQWILAGAP